HCDRMVMDAVRRIQHPESTMIDRIRNVIPSAAITGLASIFGHHPHVVPSTIGKVELAVDRDFVKIFPMDQVERFIESDEIVICALVRKSAVVQNISVSNFGHVLLPYRVILKSVFLENHAVIFP